MRKIILNIHMYGGLLCFSYLIIFGLSSLNFNHPFAFTRAKSEPKVWEKAIELRDLPRTTPQMSNDERVKTKADANHQVRRALNLFGHQRPWKESFWNTQDPNHYHASLVRPGREYEVDVYLDRGLANVKETRTGTWNILRHLHGLHGTMPGSPFVSTWAIYTEICTFFVLFAGASGVYLWTIRKNERRLGYILIASAGVVSIAMMILMSTNFPK
jgi:hypothetical protein